MSAPQAKTLSELRYAPPADETVKVTLTLSRAELEKLNAFMSGDTWERAQAARQAKLEQCVQSVGVLLECARTHRGTSGGRVCATVLASLYNGERVKFDLSDLKRLDLALFEHALNTMRACYELSLEPHQFFKEGGRLIEELIADWGLEKRRRRP